MLDMKTIPFISLVIISLHLQIIEFFNNFNREVLIVHQEKYLYRPLNLTTRDFRMAKLTASPKSFDKLL